MKNLSSPQRVVWACLLGLLAALTWHLFLREGEGDADKVVQHSRSELVTLDSRRLQPVDLTGRISDAGASLARAFDGGSEPRLDGELNAQRALIDPRSSGWETERLSDLVAEQLSSMKEALAAGDEEALGGFLTETCGSSHLVSTEKRAEVKGQRFDTAQVVPDSPGMKGRQAVAAELLRWGGRFDLSRLKFKVVGIEVGDDERFETVVLAAGDGVEGTVRYQENARWRIQWLSQGDVEVPLLDQISVEHVGMSRFEFDGGTLFRDRTAAAMALVPDYPRQYLQGNNHWSRVIPLAEGGALLGYNGLAIGDVNGDGLDDIYIPDGGSLPNRLLLHQADGTLKDGSEAAGVDWLEQTISALLVDLDNDGDQDLVTVSPPFLLFMENDGPGAFTFRGAHRSAANPYSLVAADYDGDRLLDLYVCNYSGVGTSGRAGAGTVTSYPLPYTDANNGLKNVLLKNLGDFGFRDATAETGLDQNNTRFSQAAAWEDYDGDGDPDLYVANDFGRNNLYRNEGGKRFTDIAAEAGVEDQASGMSVAWGDYDRDGQPDLYVSNMFSSAGNRVTYQARFEDGRAADEVEKTRRMARGNTLFRARGDGKFGDVSELAGVAMGRWAWGSLFADLDNDGWEDLVVANGYLTNDRDDDL